MSSFRLHLFMERLQELSTSTHSPFESYQTCFYFLLLFSFIIMFLFFSILFIIISPPLCLFSSPFLLSISHHPTFHFSLLPFLICILSSSPSNTPPFFLLHSSLTGCITPPPPPHYSTPTIPFSPSLFISLTTRLSFYSRVVARRFLIPYHTPLHCSIFFFFFFYFLLHFCVSHPERIGG